MQGPAVRIRGLSESQLRARSQSWGVLAGRFTPPDGFISELAAGETALVDVQPTIETSFETEQTDSTQTTELTQPLRVITAVEDGNWQVVARIAVRGPQSG
jgi:hypothetical protein